ncbi:phosphotransferase [Jatrophihabitans lederbergiae]|uniref:Phosphotransferase n=1 Tax=Jatrophihabitans lederbergiae TaxID=3075547 RepID=A0ABU2JBV3_9ACTN|nr:phosphotransferase [Jatrophihabitans sp. DSM 44399]MDT0262432.1 phosphotransferase [Jatrophihabitans sp. DSM 44399]
MHDDDLPITDKLVRTLLRRDAPALADRPLQRLDVAGSSNVLYRLGDDLAVRLPRQPGGSASIKAEARWSRWLAPRISVAVPEVMVVGEPDAEFPERWAVVSWIEGETPAVPLPSGPTTTALAVELGEVARQLRSLPVPSDAAADPALASYRAGRLRDVRDEINDWLARCREVPGLELDLAAAARYWASTADLPEPDVAPTWVHADLLAENLLVRGPAAADRTLAGVLDLGGLAVGRPAVGLVGAWELFGPADREVFRRTVDVGDDEWQVARAWAFAIAVMTFPYYWRTMPGRCRHRLVAARAVLDEARSALL